MISKKFLPLLAALMSASGYASQLDVSVPVEASYVSYAAYRSDISLAQTFSPGFTMRLDSIDLSSGHWSGSIFQPLTLSVVKLDGSGFPVGQELGSMTANVMGISDPQIFQNIDVSAMNVVLEQGLQYALILSSSFAGNPDEANAVAINNGYRPGYGLTDPNPYPDGELWTTEGGQWKPFSSWTTFNTPGVADLAFRTYGSAVPEAGTSTLMALGLGAMALLMRRRGSPQ